MNKGIVIYAIIITILLIGSNLGANKRLCESKAEIDKYRSYYEECQSGYNDRLDAASFYVNIIDSVVFVGMTEESLIQIFTKDTICLIDKGELSDVYSPKVDCDYVYYLDYLESYFLIKNHKVIGTLNNWSYLYGIGIEHYFKTKQRLGVD